jgi:hypothetical protein
MVFDLQVIRTSAIIQLGQLLVPLEHLLNVDPHDVHDLLDLGVGLLQALLRGHVLRLALGRVASGSICCWLRTTGRVRRPFNKITVACFRCLVQN